MDYVTYEDVVMIDFEDELLSVIFEFLHFEERKPTFDEIMKRFNIDEDYQNSRKFLEVIDRLLN